MPIRLGSAELAGANKKIAELEGHRSQARKPGLPRRPSGQDPPYVAAKIPPPA